MVKRSLIALAILTCTLACALVQTPPTPTAMPSPSAPPPTSTSTPLSPPTETATVAPTESPTLIATATETATPAPTVQVPADSIRVQFAPGATSWATEDALRRNQIKTYLVNAMQDQLMIVQLSSPLVKAYITIVGLSDGVPLARAQMGATYWSGKLTMTQDYAISVSTLDGSPARYTLNITIPRRLVLDEQRTFIEHKGHLEAFETKTYALNVPAGQLMMVDVLSRDLVGLAIVGYEDGNPYKRVVSEEPFWSGFVPMAQDYIIKVVAAGNAADYTLRVTLPREIRFASGAVEAELRNTLPVQIIDTYILSANAGQNMKVELETGGQAYLEIYGYEQNQTLLHPTVKQTQWEGSLPASQHYIIKVFSQSDKVLTYKLKVEIR